MTNRDRLIELLKPHVSGTACLCESGSCELTSCRDCKARRLADHLLANGVIVTPCVAMVEQFIKDGKFDRKRTAHNGKIAVVYIDKSKWNSPLIDITEQHYNTDKAVERIQALKEREG